jgi:uncharacterized repeat protein (TIGR03803 family)
MKLKILAFALLLTLATNLSAQTFTTLHSFTTNTDGAFPYTGLVLSGNTLYGTTRRSYSADGIYSENGTLFAVNTDGSGFKALYDMNDGAGVAHSPASLIVSGHTLYGATLLGGSFYNGSVFAANTDGIGLTNLHSFSTLSAYPTYNTNSDGVNPMAGLTLSGNTLYGTATGGGSSDAGTVFAINTDGTGFTTLHSFTTSSQNSNNDYWTNSDGTYPSSTLALSDNTLYGTARSHGSSGSGTVFAINTDGTDFTTLYNFTATLGGYAYTNSNGVNAYAYTNSDGANPAGFLILSANTLYGTTIAGGYWGNGTIFRINTDGSHFTNLYSFNFNGGIEWDDPNPGLTLTSNTLYGNTQIGGSSGNGTVFAINTDGTGYTTLYSFTATTTTGDDPWWPTNTDGANPTGELVLSGNTLYGTALSGGASGYGTVFALSLAPSAPIITTQPQSQAAQAGNDVIFTVTASVYPPPTYQWQFNGNPIAGAIGMNLSLTNVQSTNTGDYSVVVNNAYGSVTSAVARLIVYLPPSTPPPSTPASSLTTLQPPSNLTAAPRQPSSTQLVVFTDGGLVDPNKMTIVLTHGWRDTAANSWPGSMAATLINKGFGASANIVAWDWTANANMPGPDPVSLSASSARTLSEGEALGSALLNTLGTGYNLPIHFLGHSLGTMVNCHAADYIHGDDPNSPGYSNSAQKFNAQNTQMTLFDEAELANAVSIPYDVSLDILFGAQIAAQSGVNQAPWNKVIPNHSAWIDNYISLVGLAHMEAANVLLWRNDQMGLTAAHGYSIQWYSSSIANPSGSLMGHCWSSELTLNGAPARGSCFAQALNSDPLTLQLAPLDPIAATLDVYPSLQAFRALSALGSSVYGIYLNGIQYAGNFVANVAQEFAPPSGQPVFVGTADSTPAYYLPALSSSPYQSGYSLQFTLQPATSSQVKTPGLSSPTAADSGGSATNSIYAWVPVSVPPDAVGLSFQFQLTGAGTNEYITMGISNENYFALESKFVQDNAWTASSVMDISQYAGQKVQLFFSLNGYGTAPNGQLSVQAIQFYTMSAPALSIAVQGTNTVLSWPVAALGWQLETADTLTATNQWTAVTNTPVIVDYQNLVTNGVSSTARFYRLREQ